MPITDRVTLLAELDNLTPRRRWQAMCGLLALPIEEVAAELVDLLASESPQARDSAAIVLGVFEVPEVHREAFATAREGLESEVLRDVLAQGPDHPLVRLLKRSRHLPMSAPRRLGLLLKQRRIELDEAESFSLLLAAVQKYERRFEAWRDMDLWMALLKHFEDDPLTPWVVFRLAPANTRSLHMVPYLRSLTRIFGAERLRGPVERAMALMASSERRDMWGWLAKHGFLPVDDLLAMLESRDKASRLLAGMGLAARGEGAMPQVVSLLGSRKKGLRASAASIFAMRPSAASIDVISAALAKERSAEVTAALQRALVACEPDNPLAEQIRVVKVPEVYDPDEGDTINALIESLRAHLHEGEPSQRRWVQLCNLIERLRALGEAQVGVDYAFGHGVDKWDEALRPLPWCWRGDPALKRLSGPEARSWVPVHHLFEAGGKAWLASALGDIEHKVRSRRLKPVWLPEFVAWLRRGWRLCGEGDVPLEALDLRYDGGTVAYGYTGRPVTTVLELWCAKGVVVHRGKAKTTSDDPEPGGLRHGRIRIEKTHPLRERLPELVGQKYLYLKTHFGPL